MKNKKILSILILLTLMTIFSFPVFGQGQTKIFIGDSMTESSISSLIENNTTMIPLKDISKQFEVDIEKHNNDKSVTCSRGDNSIKMNIDDKIVNINGKNIMVDLSAKNINGLIYLPIRLVLENLNYDVEWDDDNKAIRIYESKGDKVDTIKKLETSYISPAKYIAHAGGRVDGLRLSNSKEAIEKSYRNGYKLIELDMEWSTDGNLVLVHDWGNFAKFINSNDEKAYSAEEFRNLKIQKTLTPLTIDDLANWLMENHGVYIVTDVKNSNVQALKFIKDRYPELINRFIPQIYHFQEYDQVKNMG